MSSSYEFVCLSHDPCLTASVEHGREVLTDDGFAAALAAVREHHPACDLALTRESGAIVEVGCCCGRYHRSPSWIDVDTLRLVFHARRLLVDAGPGAVDLRHAVERHGDAARCWPTDRISRLRGALDLCPWETS